jgi:hypothetical protein
MNIQKWLQRIVGITSILWLLMGCSSPAYAPTTVPPTTGVTPPAILSTATPAPPPTATPTPAPPTEDEDRTDGLSEEEAATLSSLEQVDDYPLYSMRYYGAYEGRVATAEGFKKWVSEDLPSPDLTAQTPAWACSLFAAFGDADNVLYGRNFDWEYSPAVLLFTDPPDRYASVSMVDIAYLGFGGTRASALTDLPLIDRRALLDAPFLPFDGMNEHGLAVGMAAVPPGHMRPEPDKRTVSSLMVIREILDRASNVDEAVAILQSYNIDFGGGPPIHYLIAARSGRSALVEFYEGEMVVIPNEMPWHLATNFLRASAGESAQGLCWRYDRINRRLTEAGGQVTTQDAMDLLTQVSQEGTQWSIVYGMSSGDVHVTMGRQYDEAHTLHLNPTGE